MTLSEAQVEYERLLHRKSTEDELWAGWRRLVEGTDKINMARNNICDNDTEGEPYP